MWLLCLFPWDFTPMDDREKEKGASSLPFLLGVYQERKEEEGEAQSLFPLFPLLACGLSLDRATMFVAAPFPPSLRFPYIPLSVSTSIPRRPPSSSSSWKEIRRWYLVLIVPLPSTLPLRRDKERACSFVVSLSLLHSRKTNREFGDFFHGCCFVGWT